MTRNAKIDFWRHFLVFAFSLFCFSLLEESAPNSPSSQQGGAKGGRRQEKHSERSQGGCHSREGSRASPSKRLGASNTTSGFRGRSAPTPILRACAPEIHTADTCDWPPMSLPLDVSHPDHGSSKGANFARVDPPQCNWAPPCTQDGIRYRMELCPEELEFLAAFRGVG